MIVLLLFLAVVVGCTTVGCLKGRFGMSIAGFLVLFGLPTIFAASRLARADSWWARQYYDDAKRDLSLKRYPPEASDFRNAMTI